MAYKKEDITDYQIRIWGSTTFVNNHKNIDYVVDSELGRLGIQHCYLDSNQEKKAIELADNIVKAIRELDTYLKEKSK